ncbi:glycosyltransferase [Pseudonocardia sp. EV170527-09]|uniref:glycosyltransferase family 2 protein n=1 Tax=Pseudonocardia sp. EV170527-09 TaxID=2603411 RepID=UPI0011F126D2|nr:glycosyltransferase [Pseudonocardia sp. EV170527-09]KAA1014053.1 glycosyltransferase [Pseudonocardia sp. EV170527-09]
MNPAAVRAGVAGRPLVSVIVPTFNRPHLLAEALGSVAAQEGMAAGAVQTVVVNDGGADVTAVVEAARAGGLAVTAVTHRHQRGLPSARNTGLDHARGRYVAFLDDDDEFLPTHLQAALARLRDPAAPAVQATIAACTVTSHRDTPAAATAAAGTGAARVGVPGTERWDVPFDPDLLAVMNLLPVHAAVFAHPGPGVRFDAALPALEDWDFWLRLSHGHGYRFTRIPTTGAVYHRSATATSMLNDVVSGARPAAHFSRLVERIWRRWPARDPRSARFRSYAGTMYWQLLGALATGRAPNPHYYLHSVQAIAAAWADPDAETTLTEDLTHTVTGAPCDDPRAA